ncbi:MAG: PepSY domain-containing protein [Verrucomicrobia bacterium]|nr:PepSY domain-containing protein [Verrucomicrobiota bacterium]MBV9674232.1 PepSY domain-containing protein [Verrucomicrobiota bacterium]
MKNLIPVATLLLLLVFATFTRAAGHAKQISKAQAEQIALQKIRNGRIENSELQSAHGKQFWSVDVARPGSKNGKEVHIDAATGKILKVSTEKPGDRAEEGLKR